MNQLNQPKSLELYIHIPFCARKCHYCDFLSAPADAQVQNAYMEALLREVAESGGKLRAEGEARTVVSVFVGGGTPSVVAPMWMERLMAVIGANFELAPDIEVSIEMNPGSVTRDGLAAYRRAGINRLSIGLQSANDEELRRLGRIHDFQQFLDTYHMAREMGFDNVNVDLMGALPGQSRQDNRENLRRVLGLKPIPEHISAYSLIVEEGTPFYEMQRLGQLKLPDEEIERQIYWDTAGLLEQTGYEHYEISNYALPGRACRHNCGYWRRTDYLGFGIGAASLFNNVRYSNDKRLEVYMARPTECHVDIQSLGREEIMEETMFLGLRMAEGISGEHFFQQFGVTLESVYGRVIEEGIREGLLADRDRRLTLTRRGIDLSNYMMAKFLF